MRLVFAMLFVTGLLPAASWGMDLGTPGAVQQYCNGVGPDPPEEVLNAWRRGCAGEQQPAPERALEHDSPAAEVVYMALLSAREAACGSHPAHRERDAVDAWIRERHALLFGQARLAVPGTDLELHEDLGVAVMTLDEEIPVASGTAAVRLHGPRRVMLDLAPTEIEEVRSLMWMEDLAIVLHLMPYPPEPATSERGAAYCDESGDIPVMNVRVAGVSLTDGTRGEVIVTHRQALLVAADLTRDVRASVTSLDIESTYPCTVREAELIRLAVEVTANRCYAAALLEDGAVRGALVVGFELTPEGRVRAPRILIDVLQQDDLSACLLAEMTRLRLSRSRTADALRLRSSVVFALPESGERPPLAPTESSE